MIKHFFPGLRVEIPDRADVARPIRGVTARLVSRIPKDSELYTKLGFTQLHWIAVVVDGPQSTIGLKVYLNELIVVPLEPEGAVPAKITMDALLRTCHADPKAILGDEGS